MYNPLDPINIGENIALAFIRQLPRPFNELREIQGAGGGIYGIYYAGTSPLYARYRQFNMENGAPQARLPIYVGSSFAVGTQRGMQDLGDPEGGARALWGRLDRHRRKIEGIGDPRVPEPLRIGDFMFRCLPLHDTHVGSGEAALISFFRPPWNGLGFGSNPPGIGRPGFRAPNAFKVAHSLSGANADPGAVQAALVEIQQRVEDQVRHVLQPPDPRIEPFMRLIRADLGIFGE
ncbi:hypothetical protein FHW79_006227 [Azospirillum sp. OGB3]|nr:hypothetical protein [Azospirillum sp. OGB3]